MAVHSIKNQYLGINAHLHSYFQAEGGWSEFHSRHIVHIADFIQAQFQSFGYRVDVEESIQIRRLDQDTLSEKPYHAINIYKTYGASKERFPFMWLELLSSNNKRGGVDHEVYYAKRQRLIREFFGGYIVEIDYLHETPPVLFQFPPYPLSAPKPHYRSSPYLICVTNLRPTGAGYGGTDTYSLNVDETIPTLYFSLDNDDFASIDFGSVYQYTFEKGFYGNQIDYSTLPQHFERYNPTDQTRIAARMLAVLEAHQQGVDLETGPLATKEIKLEEVLAAIEKMRER